MSRPKFRVTCPGCAGLLQENYDAGSLAGRKPIETCPSDVSHILRRPRQGLLTSRPLSQRGYQLPVAFPVASTSASSDLSGRRRSHNPGCLSFAPFHRGGTLGTALVAQDASDVEFGATRNT
jgi:hypothetical protein